ncbi:MAG: hypothetical protein JWR52_545 [Marmoricola sp.]|nr:hypothetical protein [Marmoricola sp.]
MKRYLPLLLLLGVFVLAAPAQAAACSGTTGVTVVVQFPDHTTISCAPGNPSSGYAALQEAGFSIAYAQGSGVGALCEIDGYPGVGACHTMPPANAYWAYFHASRGGSWSYSDTGGGGYDPAPGSVEGWRFGAGSAPSVPPPARVASTPKPTPKAAPTARPSHTATPVATPSGPRSTAATRTPSAAPTASPSANVGAAPTGPPTPPASPGLAAGTVQKASSSSSNGFAWIWGVVLIAVLGGAAGTTAVRRRRS